MEIAGDFNLALQTLSRLGLLLETDARLPSVASLIAGEPIRGSWWAHARAHEIFAALGQFDDHRDAMFTKLISGKVTLVHRKLWLEIFAIGTARAPWQMRGLSRSAVSLLEVIDEQRSLRTDAILWAKSAAAKPGEAARELEKKLLVHAGQIHTETGAHATLLETWETWAQENQIQGGDDPRCRRPEEDRRKSTEAERSIWRTGPVTLGLRTLKFYLAFRYDCFANRNRQPGRLPRLCEDSNIGN